MTIQYKSIAGFHGGLNLLKRPDAIEDTQAVEMENLKLMKGTVMLDTGYVLEDPDVGTELDPETVKLTYTMYDQDGTSQALLFTKNTLYKWSGLAWVEVLDSDGNTLDDGTARGDDVIVGDDTKPIIAITYPGSANGNNHNMVIWTNGVDRLHKFYYTGAAWVCDAIAGLPDINIEICQFVRVWQDTVWVFATEEDGVLYNHRIRWCVPGDEEKWDTTTYSAAGYYDLLSENNQIKQAEVLGPYLVVYCGNSIWRGSWLNTTSKPVLFENVVDNEGVLGGISVASLGSWHVFLGKSNIFRYVGGLSIEPFGDIIQERIYGDGGLLNLEYTDYIRAVHNKETDTVWFMFPIVDTDAGEAKTYIIRYSVKYRAWTERIIKMLLTSLSMRKVEEDDTWGGDDGKEGTWLTAAVDEAIGPDRGWISQVFLTEFPFIFFSCLDTANLSKLIRYDYIQPRDNMTGEYLATGYLDVDYASGEEIPYKLITKNFYSGSVDSRFEHLQLSVRGTIGHVMNIRYSIDDAENWSNLGTITINVDDMKRYKVWGNITFENIMFEFTGQGGNVEIGQCAFAYGQETE